MKEYTPCRSCYNKQGPLPGFYYTFIENQRYVIECPCHIRWKEEVRLGIRARESNIWENPPNLQTTYLGNKSLEDKDRLIKYASNFENYKNNIVYLYGPNGTQKTTAAMWVGLELLKKGYSVHYVLMYKLSLLLTTMFEEKESAEKILMQYKEADLLIIDESFSKDKIVLYKSGYQLPFLDSFLRERIDLQKKGILFLSNSPPQNIEKEGFSKSIQDLISRNVTQSTLYFQDNYIASKENNFEAGSLFD